MAATTYYGTEVHHFQDLVQHLHCSIVRMHRHFQVIWSSNMAAAVINFINDVTCNESILGHGVESRAWLLHYIRVAQAVRTDTECCDCANIVQATESTCTLRILHGILIESVLQVRRLQAV